MLFNRLLYAIVFLSGSVALCFIDQAVARQNIVVGGVAVGFDYENRTYDNEDLLSDPDNGDRREISFSPEIELRSLGIHNFLALRYSPSLAYDDLIDETDVDHYLDLSGEHFLNKDWQINFSDNFVYTTDSSRFGTTFFSRGQLEPDDDLDQDEPTLPDEISRDQGRARYWTNSLSFGTIYTYAQESDVEFGYAYRILRNDSSSSGSENIYEEYDRHSISGSWLNRINAYYSTLVKVGYTKGLFDEDNTNTSEDLDEYSADLQLTYTKDVSNAFPLLYTLEGTQYDGTRQDTWVHELTAIWEHKFDQRTRMSIGGGPSYVTAEDSDSELGYNAQLSLARDYQHGDVAVTAGKDFEPRNFSGSDDTGVTDTTYVRIDGTYQFTKDILSTVFASYENEDILDPQGDLLASAAGSGGQTTGDTIGDFSYTRDYYSIGGSLEYTFLRWFVASLRYSYSQQDGDLEDDSYDTHRILFQISGSKELWR